MSRFTFYLPAEEWLPLDFRSAFLAVSQDTPIPSRVLWEEKSVQLQLLEHDDCRVQVMTKTESGGGCLESTVTLYARRSPYRLELELVRGLIARLKRGAELWRASGLEVAAGWEHRLSLLVRSFIGAWKHQHEAACPQLCHPLLEEGRRLAHELTRTLVDGQGTDVFAPRPAAAKPSEARFGVGLVLGEFDADSFERMGILASQSASQSASPASSHAGGGDVRAEGSCPGGESSGLGHEPGGSDAAHHSNACQQVGRLLNSDRLDWIAVGLDWKSAAQAGGLERCQGLRRCLLGLKQERRRRLLGPWFRIEENCLVPGMSVGNEGQGVSEPLARLLRRDLPETAPHAELFHAVSGINGVGVAGLTPTIQFNIVRSILETSARLCPKLPVMISFTQPLGERLGWSVGGQTADTFLRKLAAERVPIHAIGLEIDLGYFPTGSLPRDPLQWVFDLQKWSTWGIPVFVFLRVPSRSSTEKKHRTYASSGAEAVTWEDQARSAQQFAKLLSALPWIHGVIYNQLHDNLGRFGDAGLISLEGTCKPLLTNWCR